MKETCRCQCFLLLSQHSNAPILYIQIRYDWINLTNNTLQFYELPYKNPEHTYHKIFQDLSEISFYEDQVAIIFVYIERYVEWLDLEQHGNITTWDDFFFFNKDIHTYLVSF